MESTPLISDYKLSFVGRRLLQNFLGGPQFVGRGAPWRVQFVQAFLLLWPAVLGATFVTAIEARLLPVYTACVAAGLFTALVVLACNLSARLSHPGTAVASSQEVDKVKSHTNEEDDIAFSGLLSKPTLRFIFPNVRTVPQALLYASVAGVVTAGVLHNARPSKLTPRWGSPLTGHMLCIATWGTTCVTLYPLGVSVPSEPAVYSTAPVAWLLPLFRSFYLLFILLLSQVLSFRRTLSWWHLILERQLNLVLACLPLLWVLGTLPPLGALYHWAPEWINVHVFGGSPVPSVLRTYVMFALSTGLAGLNFVLPDRLAASMVTCLLGFIFSVDLVSIYYCLTGCMSKAPTPAEAAVNRMSWSSLFAYVALGASSLCLVALPDGVNGLPEIWIGLGSLRTTVFAALLLLSWLCASLQRAYIFAGLIRNPLFPRSSDVSALKAHRRHTRMVAALRVILLKIGSPLVMVFHLANIHWEASQAVSFLECMASVFSFRLVWQRTEAALLDLILVEEILQKTGLLEKLSLSPVAAILAVDLFRHVLLGAYLRARLVLVLLVTSLRQAKQRLPYSWLLVAANIFALPLLLVLIIASALLDAPMLPLFTLPLFLLSFPRPSKFWPGKPHRSANKCQDSTYYEQLAPHFAKSLETSVARGLFGPLVAGSFLLGRLGELLLVVQVLESGWGFHRVAVKGLELQETSCHALEAAKVDELFERVFSTNHCNAEPFHLLLPLDFIPVTAYTSAHGVLTGVVDSPNFLDVLPRFLGKCLLWLLLGARLKNMEDESPSNATQTVQTMEAPTKEHPTEVTFPDTWVDAVHSPSSLESADWSDSDDPLEEVDRSEKSRRTGMEQNHNVVRSFDGKLPTRNAWSVTSKVIQIHHAWSEDRDTPLPFHLSDESRTALSPPSAWMELARESSFMEASALELVPEEEWFWSVLDGHLEDMPKGVRQMCEGYRSNHGLFLQYRCLVPLCTALLWPSDRRLTPEDVVALFRGDPVPSDALRWSTEKQELRKVVVLAFRYATKLAMDELLLGPAEDDASHLYQLRELDMGWHLGADDLPSWRQAILSEVPNLFSIGRDPSQEVYVSRRLHLREQPLALGCLETQGVWGVWASLGLELLYLSNDDEERYSIQAHPTLLRNLLVQAADPPLGYPIHATGPVTLTTLG